MKIWLILLTLFTSNVSIILAQDGVQLQCNEQELGCVGFSESERNRLAEVSRVRDLTSLTHAWLWQGENRLEELFNQNVSNDSLYQILGEEIASHKYINCVRRSVMRSSSGPTEMTSQCERLLNSVNSVDPEYNAKAQTAVRHIMFASVALRYCSEQPTNSPLYCSPGGESHQRLSALNRRMANGIPIALGDGVSTDTSFDVYTRARPSLSRLAEQQDPNGMDNSDDRALVLRSPEGSSSERGERSQSVGEDTADASDEEPGGADGAWYGIHNAGPSALNNCPILNENPLCQTGSDGQPLDESARNQVLALYASMEGPLLDEAARQMARGTVVGYFDRLMQMPHINPSNIGGTIVAMRSNCANGPLRELVLSTSRNLISEIEGQGQQFATNQRNRHAQMVADALRLNELANNLQAFNTDFASTPEGLQGIWPTWLPGGMTIARFADLGIIPMTGLNEHSTKPCGFFRGSGIASMYLERNGGINSAPETRNFDPTEGDQFLIQHGVISREHPGNIYQRCEAKRRLIQVYSTEMAEILARNPGLAEKVGEDDQEETIFRRVARQRFADPAAGEQESVDRNILNSQINIIGEGLQENNREVMGDLDEFISDLCEDPREKAAEMVSS